MIRAGGAVCLASLLAAALLGGCASSAAYPFDKDIVWSAAVAEATVWGPTLIDEDHLLVRSEKTDLIGTEILYELKVRTDYNPFARRPSARVHVSMLQTKPKRKRFASAEGRFLDKLGSTLQAMTARRRPAAGR